MKRNRKRIILVIILASASFWLIVRNGHNGTLTDKDFAVSDTASINKIFLADKSGREITLERKAQGGWTVNGKYDVRPDAIKTLLVTIKKVDVKEPIGKNAVNNVIKRLAAKAVKCEIYQNNKLVKAYYVGTETQDDTGTNMILIDLETMKPTEKPFITYIPGFEGYLTTRYFTEEQGWRDRTVLHYNPNDIASVKVEVPFKTEENYLLTIKGNNQYEIKMLATNTLATNIDPLQVKQYLSYFQQQNFESFEVAINQKQIDSVLKSVPLNILTITDKKGVTNKITFYARYPLQRDLKDDNTGAPIQFDMSRMDALLNNGKDFVMLQYLAFGKILPPVDYFRKKN